MAEAKPTTLNTVSLSYLYTSNLKRKSSCAGVQPPQDPGKPERETASGIDLEREGKKVEDKKIEERKRLPLQGKYHEETYQGIEGDRCVESDARGVCLAQVASQVCSCWVS